MLTKDELMKITHILNKTNIGWTTSPTFKGHWSLTWDVSPEIKILSLFTSSPGTVLKGVKYTNFKLIDGESYINPPLLIPKSNFVSCERYIKTKEPNINEFCKTFKCDSFFEARLYAFKSFWEMMLSPESSKEILISMASDIHGSFFKTLGIGEFNENSRAEFLKNAETYFDDKDLFQSIKIFSDIQSNDKFDILFNALNKEMIALGEALDAINGKGGLTEKDFDQQIEIIHRVLQ